MILSPGFFPLLLRICAFIGAITVLGLGIYDRERGRILMGITLVLLALTP